MSTVEAAATLFGSDGDSGPDPFAVIGNEATDTTPPPAGLMSYEPERHDSASYPSHMGQDASSLFAENQGAEPFQQDPWSVPANQDSSPPDNPQYSNYSAPGCEQPDGRHPGPSYSSTSQPQASYAQQPGLSSVRVVRPEILIYSSSRKLHWSIKCLRPSYIEVYARIEPSFAIQWKSISLYAGARRLRATPARYQRCTQPCVTTITCRSCKLSRRI